MFQVLSAAAAAAAFVLAILGSWVRINGAGMTCPDWPLCHGHVIPSLAGGVILEWSHRLVAFLEGFLVLAAVWAAWRERDRIAGIRPTLGFIVAIFAVQVLLGAWTVEVSNSPYSVVLHWGAAMLFIGGLVALAVLAFRRPRPGIDNLRWSVRGAALATTAFAAFVTMLAGADVSSSGAGLACVSLPLCDGTTAPYGWAQMLQNVHRIAAGTFFAIAVVSTYVVVVRGALVVRIATTIAFALLVFQVMLGMANVAWELPTVLRELHAANATAVFVAYVVATLLALRESPAVASARRAPSLPDVGALRTQ